MKIVRVKGGLGNQLFQYSFALLLRKLTGEEVKLDMSNYAATVNDPIRKPRLMKFSTSVPAATQEEIDKVCIFRHTEKQATKSYRLKIGAESMLNRRYYLEKSRAYTDPCGILKYDYFDGYWQSWKNVDAVWDLLKKDLVPNDPLHESTRHMIKQVAGENSVFLGVRRGDYTNWKHWGNFGNSYYQRAMDHMEKNLDHPKFYLFSNDVAWAKENIDFSGRDLVIREQEEIIDDFEDHMIMAACRHSIIMTSTFYWWGARMNDNPEKIVAAPRNWFSDNKPIDILPPHWVRIEN